MRFQYGNYLEIILDAIKHIRLKSRLMTFLMCSFIFVYISIKYIILDSR